MIDTGAEFVDVVVTDPGVRPIPIYNTVVRLTGLNVKQARKLVDDPPKAVVTYVPRTQAEALRVELEATGAKIELHAAGEPGAATDLIA
jgi:large subunit ribosomal protein L7/L12